MNINEREYRREIVLLVARCIILAERMPCGKPFDDNSVRFLTLLHMWRCFYELKTCEGNIVFICASFSGKKDKSVIQFHFDNGRIWDSDIEELFGRSIYLEAQKEADAFDNPALCG